MTKFSFKSYWAPTPKKFRKLGDGLFAASLLVAGSGVYKYEDLIKANIFTPGNIRAIIITAIIIGGVGKILSNFFGEEEKPDQ